MIEVYVEMDAAFEHVVSYSTKSGLIKVIQDDPVIDMSKLQGYTLVLDETNRYHLVFDEAKYAQFEAQQQRERDIQTSCEMGNKLLTEMVLTTVSDEDAYIMRYLYPLWTPDTSYEVGDRMLYVDNLYKCKQEHTSQEQQTPDLIPALWDIISDDSQGTKENPIVVPDAVSSMVYAKGKYYLEDGVLYLMNRQGMEDGEEISLTFKPSELIGQYFEVVE